MNETILVTGATGPYGKTAIDLLLQHGISAGTITALVRDTSKAHDLQSKGVILKKGDYSDYSSLVEAFQGIDQLLFVSSSEIANMQEQHINVVQAAKSAGIKRIVYTSTVRKNETEASPVASITIPNIETEDQIKKSGLRYAIMKNDFYADALPMFLGDEVLESGIFFPAGDGKAAYATRADMAEAAANLIVRNDDENKEYIFAGNENLSMQNIANMLSELTGQTVPFISPSIEVYRKSLSDFQVPADQVEMIISFAEAIEQDDYSVAESDLEKILLRKPTTLREYLKSVYAK